MMRRFAAVLMSLILLLQCLTVPVMAQDDLQMTFDDGTLGTSYVSDALTNSDLTYGGVVSKVVDGQGAERFLRLSAQNTVNSTAAARARIKTVKTCSDTFTVQWDLKCPGAGFPQLDVYLRSGGNVRIRVDTDGKVSLLVLNAAKVPGIMESVYGQTALSVGSWYTFKAEVTPEKIALSVYERGGKTPLETLTIGQDSSVYAKLFEPYNIWFDMWGSPDLADTQPVRMDLDNLMISSGIYEGLEQPPESAVIQTRPFDTVTVRADGGEVKVDNVSLQNMDGSYTLHRESFDELTQSALPDLWKAEGDTVTIKADNGGQATGRSVFAGKKVSILGDSISTYAGVSDNTA
ncbi:MAG: hypothetical protein IJP02_04315 [Oscillospiraceae bacterium]|nr:hypothetical protein [Oscillospiraceae bacterium]